MLTWNLFFSHFIVMTTLIYFHWAATRKSRHVVPEKSPIMSVSIISKSRGFRSPDIESARGNRSRNKDWMKNKKIWWRKPDHNYFSKKWQNILKAGKFSFWTSKDISQKNLTGKKFRNCIDLKFIHSIYLILLSSL